MAQIINCCTTIIKYSSANSIIYESHVNMNMSFMTDAVSIELCKTFDTVDYAGLLSERPLYSTKNKELNWL